VIVATGLVVSRGGADVVRGVSIDVAGGAWLTIVGPNGAGKSSMLLALAGLIPAAGSIVVGGVSIAEGSTRTRARRVALVAQQPVVPEALTVAEYVSLGRTPHLSFFGTETARDHELADEVLARIDLTWAAERRVDTLSGGEFRRAVVGRALAQEAEVLLLDEPTTGLDLGHQVDVLELVDELRRERGITVVSAMHDLTLAARFSDRFALLAHGEIVAEGTPAEVLDPHVLARHYGIAVHVVHGPGGELIVVPARTPVGRR